MPTGLGSSADNPLHVTFNDAQSDGTSGVEFPESGRIWGLNTRYTVVNNRPAKYAPRPRGLWARFMNRWVI